MELCSVLKPDPSGFSRYCSFSNFRVGFIVPIRMLPLGFGLRLVGSDVIKSTAETLPPPSPSPSVYSLGFSLLDGGASQSLRLPAPLGTHRYRPSAAPSRFNVQMLLWTMRQHIHFPPYLLTATSSPFLTPVQSFLSPEFLLLLRSHFPHCDTHTYIYIYKYRYTFLYI